MDSHGDKVRYDHKVGTEKWPLKVTFSRGNTLNFLFHSDSSNTEWGYKFKVLPLWNSWLCLTQLIWGWGWGWWHGVLFIGENTIADLTRDITLAFICFR